jgi:AbrB family looped-hinge helix DNA binding protein
MSITVGIDLAGRILVPKKLRNALNLTPGTQLSLERFGEGLVIKPNFPDPQLVLKDRMWVMTKGPKVTEESATVMIDEQRERRMRYAASLSDEP